MERTFEEERRRSKVIPRFNDEKSAMKLVFATLMRVSDRWNRVSVSDRATAAPAPASAARHRPTTRGSAKAGSSTEEGSVIQAAVFTGDLGLDLSGSGAVERT